MRRRNTTTKRAIPTHKFYSAFLRNGICKFPRPEGQLSYGDILQMVAEGKPEPKEMTVEKLLYNYGCLYHTIGKLEDDISILFEAYDRTLEELGKENPNNELYILRSKHFKAKK